MSIKESSDELNPPIVAADSIPKPKTRSAAKDFLALAIATCGVGYLPLAPGTWGSLIGVALSLIWHLLRLRFFAAYGDGRIALWTASLWIALTLAMVVVATIVGIWAATQTEQLVGRKDSRIVVIDEVVGQMIALLFIPNFLWLDWQLIIAGFVLFRIFDIWKPYPIRNLEKLPGGVGVMADDVVAGCYAATALAVIVAFRSVL